MMKLFWGPYAGAFRETRDSGCEWLDMKAVICYLGQAES